MLMLPYVKRNIYQITPEWPHSFNDYTAMNITLFLDLDFVNGEITTHKERRKSKKDTPNEKIIQSPMKPNEESRAKERRDI